MAEQLARLNEAVILLELERCELKATVKELTDKLNAANDKIVTLQTDQEQGRATVHFPAALVQDLLGEDSPLLQVLSQVVNALGDSGLKDITRTGLFGSLTQRVEDEVAITNFERKETGPNGK